MPDSPRSAERHRWAALPPSKRNRIKKRLAAGSGIVVVVIALAVYFLVLDRPNTTFNEIAIQPRPHSPATVGGDVNAELGQTASNGGQLLITEIAGSTIAAPAFYGELSCPPGTNKIICEQSTSGELGKARRIADELVDKPDPAGVDIYAVFAQTAGYLSEHPGHYQAINLWINTTGARLTPENLNSLTSSQIQAVAHQAVASGAFPGPHGCQNYQVHMVVPPDGSSSQQENLRELFGKLIMQCGGTLVTWTDRWIGPSGNIPLPQIPGAGTTSQGAYVLSDRLKDFAVGSAALTATAKKALAQIAIAIETRRPNRRITCIGSTDGTGSAAFDKTLSEQRAVAVCGYLAGQGVPSSLLQARGIGKATPKAANPQLRRVIITLK